MTALQDRTNIQPDKDTLADRTFGFWVYLMSDAVIFALLFATFAIMLRSGGDIPPRTELFGLHRAFAETLLLLTSSVAFGFAHVGAEAGQRRTTLAWLGFTFLLGVGFLGLEIDEFTGLLANGNGPQRDGFLSAFFTLVGAHGMHVAGGLFWIVALGCDIALRGLSLPAKSRLLRLGLFWHFLDIVWIGIFSVVYLPGFVT